MRKTIIATLAAAVLLGCGKDSTGPGDGNPNPDPQRYVITIDGTDFSPDVLPAPSADPIYIGDWIVWQVAAGDEGEHQIHFTNVPSGATITDSKTLGAGDKDSVAFVKAGTYEYADVVGVGGVKGSGTITVSPLP
jgi:plastocyanin